VTNLQRQVRRARWRLAGQSFLHTLARSWFAALLAAALVIGVDKVYPLNLEPWAVPLAALGLGLLVAVVATLARRPSELDAAWEIDRRFGLRERVSSSLGLDNDQAETPVGRALVEDADRRVQRLTVAEKFPLAPERRTLLPLLGAGLALLAASYMPNFALENQAQAITETEAQKQQVQKSSQALREKLVSRRKDAEQKGLKTAEELLEKLEQGTRQMASGDQTNRQQSLIKLNELAKELEKRRDKLAGGDQLKEQLQQLGKGATQGAADRLAQALRAGKLQQAIDEVKKLRDQLEKGELNQEAQAKLGQQLAEMEQQLREMAEAQKRQEEQLERQIAESRAAGQSEQTKALEERLQKLRQQMAKSEAAQKLASKLGQCAKCMKQGDSKGAAASLDSMQSELASLSDQVAESDLLDAALDEISEAKSSMNCKQCGGSGCKACNGEGDGGFVNGPAGRGKGGKGFRPEQDDETATYDTRAPQKIGRGAAIISGLVEGPNAKGQVQQEIKTQWDAAASEASDPLAGQQLPREYREHAKKYFDALREGGQ
jgi:hypothetical protein